ncbi:short-chain dehydrogenase [Candidatus Binatus sp.]|uniref:short-chain dehydrogenase n=1 Tax=Candidatus Binatus sp. TaxID=2811406 RepID=UPI003BCF1CB2
MSESNSGPKFPLLSSIQDFLFGAPLYAEYDFDSAKLGDSGVAFYMFNHPLVVDGYCPHCHKAATFSRTAGDIEIGNLKYAVENIPALGFEIACARNAKHTILFVLKLKKPLIQKIGQYPSLADIANDESRNYREVLNPDDGAELHRAIGLAAHGVGVGSFVYLRRVFERLITRRFEEFKAQEGWKDADFVGKRMEEKIEFLKHHLPEFLVRNKKVYAILSIGIHELEETQCLNAFEMLKQAIFLILDQDRHKREELDRLQKAEKAIGSFSAEKRSK